MGDSGLQVIECSIALQPGTFVEMTRMVTYYAIFNDGNRQISHCDTILHIRFFAITIFHENFKTRKLDCFSACHSVQSADLNTTKS
jgi:hypothetical protein